MIGRQWKTQTCGLVHANVNSPKRSSRDLFCKVGEAPKGDSSVLRKEGMNNTFTVKGLKKVTE